MLKTLRISKRKNDLFLEACRSGDLESVKKLTDKKQITFADPMCCDGRGLILAAEHGHDALFYFLDRFGYVDDVPLSEAVCTGPSLEILKYYLYDFMNSEHPDRHQIIVNMMRQCAGAGDIEKLKIFFDYPQCFENSPLRFEFLHTAIRLHQVDMIQYLLPLSEDFIIEQMLSLNLVFTDKTIGPFVTLPDGLSLLYQHGYDISYAARHRLDDYLLPAWKYGMSHDPVKTMAQMEELSGSQRMLCIMDDTMPKTEELTLYL